MKVFISGGTGLVGFHLIQTLLSSGGVEMKILATYHSGNGQFIKHPRVTYHKADLMNLDECRAASKGCDLAVMCAGYVAGSLDAKKYPWKQTTTNLVMETNQLQSFHDNNVHKVVYLSSASLYQHSAGDLVEDHLDFNIDPPKGQFGVGWVKRYSEKNCMFWSEFSAIRFNVLRLTNVYGPGVKFSNEVSNFLPALIKKFSSESKNIAVLGSRHVSRDIVHAQDVALSILKLFDCFDEKIATYNLGYGKSVTVHEVCEILCSLSNRKMDELTFETDDKFAPQVRKIDCTKLANKIKWTPQICPNVGIGSLFHWWTENQYSWNR